MTLVRYYDIKTDQSVWVPVDLIDAYEAAMEAWIQSGGVPAPGGHETGDPLLRDAVIEAGKWLEDGFERDAA